MLNDADIEFFRTLYSLNVLTALIVVYILSTKFVGGKLIRCLQARIYLKELEGIF